jgi:hypothetical protein
MKVLWSSIIVLSPNLEFSVILSCKLLPALGRVNNFMAELDEALRLNCLEKIGRTKIGSKTSGD